jgi:hypothetical protein
MGAEIPVRADKEQEFQSHPPECSARSGNRSDASGSAPPPAQPLMRKKRVQGLEQPTNAVEDRHHERKEAKRPVHIPRGSASLVPAGSSSLPQTPSLGPPLAVIPYNPPAINSPSDRVQHGLGLKDDKGVANDK